MNMQTERERDCPQISLPKRKRTMFFLILYSLFTFDLIARVGINSIFPLIQADLQLTDVQVGMMGSIVLFGMAVFVLPISFLGEKYSTKKGITLSALIWSIGTLISGMANNFSTLLISRFFVGSGNSAYAPLSNSLLTSMYPKGDWGKKIGIYNTGMTLGMALGAIVFANIANQFGWRVSFYTVGLASLVLTFISLLLPDPNKILSNNSTSSKKASTKNQVTLKNTVHIIAKNKSLLGICLGAGLMSTVLQGNLSWLSIFFVREMNLSLAFTATLISIISLVSAFGYPIGGAIMDKWYKRDKRVRVFLPALSISFAVLCFSIGFYFKIIVLVVAGGFFLTTACTAYHVSTQELVPTWLKSISYGVYVVFIQFFGAAGPLLIGALSEKLSLVNALMIVQLINILAVVIFLIARRTYISDFNKARQLEADTNA